MFYIGVMEGVTVIYLEFFVRFLFFFFGVRRFFGRGVDFFYWVVLRGNGGEFFIGSFGFISGYFFRNFFFLIFWIFRILVRIIREVIDRVCLFFIVFYKYWVWFGSGMVKFFFGWCIYRGFGIWRISSGFFYFYFWFYFIRFVSFIGCWVFYFFRFKFWYRI